MITIKVIVVCEKCGYEVEFTPEDVGNHSRVKGKLREKDLFTVDQSFYNNFSTSPDEELIENLSLEKDKDKIGELLDDPDSLNIEDETDSEITFSCRNCGNSITLTDLK